MVADEPALEAMVDQPGIAVLTGEAMPAVAAKRQWRIAAAVEEQQRLLATLECGLDRVCQPRRDEATARRALTTQVDRLDVRQMRAAEALGQMQAPIAGTPCIHLRLDR